MTMVFGLPRPSLSNPKFFPAGAKPQPLPKNQSGWTEEFMAALAAAEQRGYERGIAEAQKVAAVAADMAINDLFPPAILDIAKQVATKYELLSWRELRSHRRSEPLMSAKRECWWRCKRETDHSYPEIGRFFGYDHTTIIHGVNVFEKSQAKTRS